MRSRLNHAGKVQWQPVLLCNKGHRIFCRREMIQGAETVSEDVFCVTLIVPESTPASDKNDLIEVKISRFQQPCSHWLILLAIPHTGQMLPKRSSSTLTLTGSCRTVKTAGCRAVLLTVNAALHSYIHLIQTMHIVFTCTKEIMYKNILVKSSVNLFSAPHGQPQLVLGLLLIFGQIWGSCSYKTVLKDLT